MKFTIKKSIFADCLANVQRAISFRTTIPILTGIKLQTNEKGLILTGSDSTLSIENLIEEKEESNHLSISEPGSVILPSRFLGDIIRKLPEDKITVAVQDNFQTIINSGESVFTLNGTSGKNYPQLPEINSAATFNLPGHLMRQAINYTIISVSSQETRPIFTGIHFELGDNQLKAISTDSHRLSQRIIPITIPESLKDKEKVELNIPGRALSELSRLVNDNENISMMVTNNQVLFKMNNTSLYSRLLEGTYPDTTRLLTKDQKTSIKVNAAELGAAVERALILSHQGKNNMVKLSMDNSGIILSGHSSEIGYVKEKINALGFEGENMSISFNPDYLREALKTFGGQDVIIRFTSPSHPFILLPSEDSDNFNMIQLITPIRTPGN